MNVRKSARFIFFGLIGVAALFADRSNAQNLTLEGQTGGFITPTAYVVYSAKDKVFSHPSVGYHFVDADKVIGDLHNFSIEEGIANRGEFGYTRVVHWTGDSATLSNLWHFAGMNVFNGKVIAIKDGQFGALMPGLAVGGVVRTGDKFLSGALNQEFTGNLKSYTNGDVYVTATKTWLHPPLPFLLNVGWKATNASIYGIGGQATRFGGRAFGGLGIPLPFLFKTAIVPSAGFSQEPPTSVNVGSILIGGRAHIPTTLDYAVRLTQKEHPHFSFDVGVGQVAGMVGTTEVPTGLPSPYPPVILVPVSFQARHVLGVGLSIRP